MSHAVLTEIGYRWTKPSWERTADRTWVLIVPTRYVQRDMDDGMTTDPYFDRSQRYYEVYEFDGTWLDQLHEMQVEQLLKNPRWRYQFCSVA